MILNYQAQVSSHIPEAYCMMEDCLTFILKEQAQRICNCNGSRRLIEFMPAIEYMNPICLDDFYSSWVILESHNYVVGHLLIRTTGPGLMYTKTDRLAITGFEPIELTLVYKNDTYNQPWKQQ